MTIDETRPERWESEVENIDQRLRSAADELAVAIYIARSTGVTWAAIGSTLRVSKQAVQQRFG